MLLIKKRRNSQAAHSQLPGQLEAEEARELEEALRLSAQEAAERQKKKGKVTQKAPQEVGEPSTANVTPKKRKAGSETSASSPSLERNITITTHSPLGLTLRWRSSEAW